MRIGEARRGSLGPQKKPLTSSGFFIRVVERKGIEPSTFALRTLSTSYQNIIVQPHSDNKTKT